MTEVATISLHDAGRRLAELHTSREQVACGRLLSLLRSDQIKAGFQFPVGRVLSWIAIPAHYWATVSGDEFKVIRYSKTSPKSGAFKVRLGQFADEVVAQVIEAPGHEQVASDKWKGVLAATSHRYEVAIIEADWAAYEQRNPPSAPALKKKSKLGRPQKNWKELCVIIAAYIIKHHQVSPKDKIKVELASETIHKIAKDDEISDLPTAPTIKEALSNILKRAEVISIN